MPWVKSNYYSYIFNACYNIDFDIPKADRCEKCEEIKINKSQKYQLALKKRTFMI